MLTAFRDKLLVSFMLGYKIPYSIANSYAADRCYRWTFEESSIEVSIVELYPASKKWKVHIDYYCNKAANVLQKNNDVK